MRISDWSSDVCSSDLDLDDYKRLILDRFANPEIADTAQRLCFDGSNRQPKFIIPSIRDNIARGVMPAGLILASALWRSAERSVGQACVRTCRSRWSPSH